MLLDPASPPCSKRNDCLLRYEKLQLGKCITPCAKSELWRASEEIRLDYDGGRWFVYVAAGRPKAASLMPAPKPRGGNLRSSSSPQRGGLRARTRGGLHAEIKPKVMRKSSVTGRDGYLVHKSLAYAIEAIERLPEERQEVSDQADMKVLLEHLVRNDLELQIYIDSARRHLDGTIWRAGLASSE